MTKVLTMQNIVITYSVGGSPLLSSPMVHAMRKDQATVTLCGRHPVNYTICDETGRSTTCPDCLAAAADVVPPDPLPRRSSHRKIERTEPVDRRSRTWVITDKGRDYLADLEARERGE